MTDSLPATPPPAPCANCNAPLQGGFCHACGQPTKGMIRPLSGMFADVIDSVFNIDSRTVRTIGPLFFRPGFLTTEYFVGRRVRYVTPFRLFFFLTIVAFFAVQTYTDQLGLGKESLFDSGDEDISGAKTPEDAQKLVDEALKELAKAKAKPNMPEGAIKGLDVAAVAIREKGKERIDWLNAAALAREKNLPVPPEPDGNGDISFNGKPWDAKANPLKVDWLPEAGNTKLNELVGNAKNNLKRAKTEPKRLIAGFFGVLPQTLFVLMPVFAVLLKGFFLFKRRLYMEHLIVALHSHAFISAAFLLIALLGLAKLAFPVAAAPLGWVMVATSWWIPLYLLLMQKRVYRQGWIMTVLKFGVIGICYSVLISFALAIAVLISLVVA